MAYRITDISKDIPKLNVELSRLDQHQQQLARLQSQVGQLQKLLLEDAQVAPENHLSQNNLTFVWTGGTLTISWAAGYIHSSGQYIPVKAGSFVGTASTFYWIGWNPAHQTMSFQNNLQVLHNVDNILIICQVFTGTAGQSGNLGGGGTESGGVGISGKQYKLF